MSVTIGGFAATQVGTYTYMLTSAGREAVPFQLLTGCGDAARAAGATSARAPAQSTSKGQRRVIIGSPPRSWGRHILFPRSGQEHQEHSGKREMTASARSYQPEATIGGESAADRPAPSPS